MAKIRTIRPIESISGKLKKKDQVYKEQLHGHP